MVKTLIIPTKIIYIFLIVFLWFLWELVLVFFKYIYVEGIEFKVLRLPLIIASTSLSGTSLVFMICLNRFSDIFPVFSVSKFLEWCVWHYKCLSEVLSQSKSMSKVQSRKDLEWLYSAVQTTISPPAPHHISNFSQQPDIQLSSIFHSRLT